MSIILKPAARVRVTRVITLLLIAATAVFAGVADALPKLDSARPAIRLVDGWDRAIDLGKFQRPVLVVYEDEESTTQNKALKTKLLDLARTKRYGDAIASVLVVDVTAYDYWPARGSAKAELRRMARELGITIYGDFSGEARKSLGAEKGRSNFLLYSRDGKLLFAGSGELDDDAREKLLAMLAQLAGG